MIELKEMPREMLLWNERIVVRKKKKKKKKEKEKKSRSLQKIRCPCCCKTVFGWVSVLRETLGFGKWVKSSLASNELVNLQNPKFPPLLSPHLTPWPHYNPWKTSWLRAEPSFSGDGSGVRAYHLVLSRYKLKLGAVGKRVDMFILQKIYRVKWFILISIRAKTLSTCGAL